MAVTTRLPTISYLTILDKYAMPALINLMVLFVYHAIIASCHLNTVQIENVTKNVEHMQYLAIVACLGVTKAQAECSTDSDCNNGILIV